jgi:hypothetical protein
MLSALPRSLLMGEDAQLPRRRQVLLTAFCLVSTLLVALGFPTAAEKMFAGKQAASCMHA